MAENKKPTALFERIDNFVRGLANGLTFGAADYIAGMAETVRKGGTVSGNIRKELDRTEAADRTGNEVLAGHITGSLISGVKAASSMARFLNGSGLRFTALDYRLTASLAKEADIAAKLAKGTPGEVKALMASIGAVKEKTEVVMEIVGITAAALSTTATSFIGGLTARDMGRRYIQPHHTFKP